MPGLKQKLFLFSRPFLVSFALSLKKTPGKPGDSFYNRWLRIRI